MTASMLGTADFDRDVRQHISQVRWLEAAPSIKTFFLNLAVATMGPPTLFLLNGVLRLAHWRLVRKTDRLGSSIQWFNEKYDDFYERVCQGSYIPDQRFIDAVRHVRAKNHHLMNVCNKSRDDMKLLNASPQVVHAFENLASMAIGMDGALARFEDLAVAAHSCEVALKRSRELSKDIRATLANYDADDELMNDPELVAAAKAAVGRIRANTI
ncbi:MAG: hypothetical protein Q8R06_06575 [Polaromonas sp.]|uniref:hypothetical protein n=2 Tax=Polaromonas sp. TaxID=1869339 RepID=UPI00273303D1|nr:hypothetical protein [Polaromonas sp.]MDP3796801.1 hypothetical protein [Polaromonas sp.]